MKQTEKRTENGQIRSFGQKHSEPDIRRKMDDRTDLSWPAVPEEEVDDGEASGDAHARCLTILRHLYNRV